MFAAGIISGTEFLKTDFSGQIHLGQIPINQLLFLWKLQEQSQMKKQFKEQSRHQFDTKSVDPVQPFGEFGFTNH